LRLGGVEGAGDEQQTEDRSHGAYRLPFHDVIPFPSRHSQGLSILHGAADKRFNISRVFNSTA
jgi:hypothetical protein